MPEIPFVSGGVARTVGATGGASSVATTLTANASANTKGTAVELAAATEFDANWLLILLTGMSANASYLTDVMIGASTEQVVVPDLYSFGRAAEASWGPYLFPVFVPKGSRLSARCQCSTGGSTLRIAVTLIAGTLLGGGQAPAWVEGYGATANSIGTNLDPGASANTDATVEIAAATTRAHNWLCVGGRFGGGTIASAASWRLSVCVGSATEQAIVPDLHVSADTTGDLPYDPVICLPCFVPAGSRLTVRGRCSSATDGIRDMYLKIWGAG